MKMASALFLPAMLLCCTLGLLAFRPAAADEPEVLPPPVAPAECRGVPILSKIPYLSRLFKNVEVAGECDTAQAQHCPLITRTWRAVGPDGAERIGIDFDFDCQLLSAEEPCEGRCPALRACSEELCTEEFCSEEECGEEVCREEVCGEVVCSEVVCSEEACDQSRTHEALVEARLELELYEALSEAEAEFREREMELIKELFEARIAAAVATATLKARDKAVSGEAKLREELADARRENSRLQARLEVADEKAELLSQLHQARVELAALRGEVPSLARPYQQLPAAETSRTPSGVR